MKVPVIEPMFVSILDRTVVLWSTSDWHKKDHKSLRVNVDFDHAVLVRWSPDSKAFVIHKAHEDRVEVYKVAKKPDGWIGSVTTGITFPKIEPNDVNMAKVYEDDVVGLDIAVTGRYMMTCSEGTDLVLWDLKGEILARVAPNLIANFRARVSPCGQFVAASGFIPGVKVWEVVFSKTGEFDRVARAFELIGHSSGVDDFGFSADSSRMATVSKDGTWKVYNTKIDYKIGEEPHLLITGEHSAAKKTEKSHLALSPDGEVLALAHESDLFLYQVHNGKLHTTIRNIYSGPITSVRFDSSGKYVLTSGQRHVRVFHNATGYLTTIATSEAKLKQSGLSAATKERLNSLIQSSKKFLDELGDADAL